MSYTCDVFDQFVIDVLRVEPRSEAELERRLFLRHLTQHLTTQQQRTAHFDWERWNAWERLSHC